MNTVTTVKRPINITVGAVKWIWKSSKAWSIQKWQWGNWTPLVQVVTTQHTEKRTKQSKESSEEPNHARMSHTYDKSTYNVVHYVVNTGVSESEQALNHNHSKCTHTSHSGGRPKSVQARIKSAKQNQTNQASCKMVIIAWRMLKKPLEDRAQMLLAERVQATTTTK